MSSDGSAQLVASLPTVIREPETPHALLEALLKAGAEQVLLLGHGQTLKPGALRALAQLARSAPLSWCVASPHPDCDLGLSGRWLMAEKRPPFACSSQLHTSPWGLLGSAEALARSLARALATLREGEAWQAAFSAELAAERVVPVVVEPALLFQESLPSAEQLLEEEARHGRTWRRLHAEGHLGAHFETDPATRVRGEVPAQKLQVARALDTVPDAGLRGAAVAGTSAVEIVPALTRSMFSRAVSLAFSSGWHAAAPKRPASRVAVKRVAVVYPVLGGSLNVAQRSAHAFERLGFEVVRIDPSHHAPSVPKDWNNQAGEELFLGIERECLAQLLASNAQLVWIVAQAPLGPASLRALQSKGMLTAFWFCEDYRVFLKWHVPAMAVDAFFPIQSGAFAGALAAAGVAAMPVLPMAAARDACFGPEPSFDSSSLSFFGAPFRNRIALFEALADLPLELYGQGWAEEAGSLLRPLVKNGNLLSEAQGFELFRSSAVNINLHSSPFHHGVDPLGDYINPRAYEIAACAGFQLLDRRRDLPAAFEEGRELVAFASAAELREQFLRWVDDREGRRRLALASRQRVLAEHTYEHRIDAGLRALQIAVPDRSILS